jgi:hypothetical protein
VCWTQKLTTGELSCAIFPYLEVVCFLFIQKWNEYGFCWGIGFMCLRGLRCAENTKVNHGRTELCNISRFGILLPVHSEVEWVQILLENCVCEVERCPVCAEHKY